MSVDPGAKADRRKRSWRLGLAVSLVGLGAGCVGGETIPSGLDGGSQEGSAGAEAGVEVGTSESSVEAGASEAGSEAGMDGAADHHVGDDSAVSDASDGSAADAADGDGSSAMPDAATTSPSCAADGPGTSQCGSSSESCCTSLPVSAGSFYRTYSNPGGDAVTTSETAPASVSAFRLDKYLVTVGRFRSFVRTVLPPSGTGWRPSIGSGKHTHLAGGLGLLDSAAAGNAHETGWQASYDTNIAPTNANLSTSACYSVPSSTYMWTASPGSQENLPIGCVNWYEAYAFCIWDGGFLPSEAELRYAAAGGSEQRAYPWGGTDPGTSNQYAIYGCDYPGESGSCTGAANIAPVGSAPLGASLWGQLDLAGDISERTVDWLGAYVSPCADCADLSGGTSGITLKANLGGSFWGSAATLQPAYRSGGNDCDTCRDAYVGFRCARTP